MNRITAIKTFFEAGKHGRKVTTEELKALSSEERQWLAEEAAKAEGWTLE